MAAPFYVKDLSIRGFWYPWRGPEINLSQIQGRNCTFLALDYSCPGCAPGSLLQQDCLPRSALFSLSWLASCSTQLTLNSSRPSWTIQPSSHIHCSTHTSMSHCTRYSTLIFLFVSSCPSLPTSTQASLGQRDPFCSISTGSFCWWCTVGAR